MTNAIEQAKREMYRTIGVLKIRIGSMISESVIFQNFESALEAYLELLRQDHEALHETARKRFEDLERSEMLADSFEKTLDVSRQYANLISTRLAKMTEERDAIQLRLHAVDHAYKTQQERTATPTQDSVDRASCEATGGQKAEIQGALADIRKFADAWALTGRRAKKSMLKISGILARPEVYAAMESIGQDEPCKPGEKDWREIAAEHEERHEAMKAKAEAERRKYRLQEVKMNCAVAGVALGINQALWSAMTAPAKKDTCQHSFFAIGQDQMKCTFCGVGK